MLLAALVLPLEGPALPQALHARGWVYNLLRETAPEVHDAAGPKPFTVGVGGRPNAPWLRLTCLTEEVYAALSPALWRRVGLEVRLGEDTYRIKAVLEAEHPWAGLVTWPRLFQGEAGPDLGLEFASPTFFRRQGANYPLPEPRLVLGSLIERWNAHAPTPVPPGVAARLVEATTLRYLNGRTVSAVGHDRTVGFRGRVTYHLPRASAEEARWLAALGRFAFFSGVGAKTTLGFGQVRPYALPAPKASAASLEP